MINDAAAALVTRMNSPVTFFQTSDAALYDGMLRQSSRTVRLFCDRHGYGYESYTGLKIGHKPWHAAYNRVYIFSELIERGWRGWAIYLDADAYIVDQEFDLDSLLNGSSSKAAIMTPAGHPQAWWDVNSGVIMLNLANSQARSLVRRWRRRLDRAPAVLSSPAQVWAPDGLDDQSLLQMTLRDRPSLRRHLLLADPAVINHPQASFIRQLLRLAGSIELRTAVIRAEIDNLLGVEANADQPVAPG